MSDDKVVDLFAVKADRLPPTTRFVLEATDVDARRFSWKWWIEDFSTTQWRPTAKMIAAQLRRVVAEYDPTPKGRRIKRRKGRR